MSANSRRSVRLKGRNARAIAHHRRHARAVGGRHPDRGGDLLPWARESSGFRGAIGLVDPETGKALLLTLWADEEARANSAAAADRLSAMAASATGARRESIVDLDVTLFDVVGGTPRIG